MKKTIENRITKLCETLDIVLSYDKETDKSYIGKHRLSKVTLKEHLQYDKIKKKMKDMNDDDIVKAFKEYSLRNEYVDEAKERKKAEAIAKAEAKEAEKAAKAKAKEDEKAEKEAKKAEKEAKKKAEIAKAKAEYDARTNISNMDDWEKSMIRDNKGFIDRNQKRNMYAFFKYKDEFKETFKFNSFSGIETYKGNLIEPHVISKLSLVTEQYIQNNNESWVASVTNILCHENEYNPIIKALEMLPEWDGVPRVETYLIDYIGAKDTRLNRNMTKKFFYAMFERLYRPGCRFDHMLISYDDKKGTGKTSILIILLEALMEFAGNSVEDSGIIALNDLGFDKDVVQCLNKAWIAYVDELAKFLKEEPEDVKKFITMTVDNARLSYARLNKNFPRHCVLYGSTNTKLFIKDNSDDYERRFWVVDCEGERHESKSYWDEALPLEKKLQILAEAYKFWKDNQLYEYNELDDEDIKSLKIVQKEHMTVSSDDILSSKLMTILDFEYSKDTFESYYEWRNEAKSMWEAYQRGDTKSNIGLENDFFYQNMLKNELKNEQKLIKNEQKVLKNEQKMIKKLPIRWVKQFIQEELGRMIADPNYINKLICYKWDKNWNVNYVNNGNIIEKGCFIRFA